MKATLEVSKAVTTVHSIAKELGTDVTLTRVTPKELRTLMRKAGTKIASVHFTKRSDNSLRKMCYRLGVTNPKTATAPKGNTNKKSIDVSNNQMTVYDVNKVVRNGKGEIQYGDNGKQLRGAWRTVPLENVTRVCVDGVTYCITR